MFNPEYFPCIASLPTLTFQLPFIIQQNILDPPFSMLGKELATLPHHAMALCMCFSTRHIPYAII